MSKKKKHTFLWSVINIVCWAIVAILIRDIVYQIRQESQRTYFPSAVALEHNKYGDYLVGLMAKQNHDYDKMISAFEGALNQDPDNLKLKKNVYLLKAIRGDIHEVLPLAQDLNTLNQAELLTDYVLISDKIKQEAYEEAKKILAQKSPYGSDRILKPVLNAWIAVGQNKRAEAEKYLKELNTINAKASYHYYMALVALAFQDSSTAEKSFHLMNEYSQNGYPSLTAIVFMRDFYTRLNKWQAGLAEYDRTQILLNGSPSVKEVFQDLKSPDTVTPQIGSAIAFYDVSVALAPLKAEETSLLLNALAMYLMPDEISFKIWAGELLEMSGNYQAANHIYKKIEKQNDVILMKTATNFITLEEYEKSLTPLKILADHNPDDGYIQLLLGDSLTQIKSFDKALEAYKKAVAFLQKEKNNAATGHALFMLAMVYDNMGNTAKAEDSLLEALRLVPNNADILNYLGYLWLNERKNIDEAFKMVQKASEQRPDDPNIMDSLALGYYLKKDYQKALELAEKSTDQISYSSVAYAHLGDIYAALNRPQEAQYQYRKALDLTVDMTPTLKEELTKKLNLTR